MFHACRVCMSIIGKGLKAGALAHYIYIFFLPFLLLYRLLKSLVETILYGAQMSGPHLLKIKRNVYDCHLLQHDGNLKIPILYVGCLSVILRAVLLIHFIITSRLVPVSRTGVWLIGDPISDYFWKRLKIIRSFHLLFVITF